MKKACAYYKQKFASYPDVVTIAELQKMLGGISEKVTRRFVRENQIKHFMVDRAYRIPKDWVIDFVLSSDYLECKDRLSARV